MSHSSHQRQRGNTQQEDPESYLNKNIYPQLLPAIEQLLKSIKKRELLSTKPEDSESKKQRAY
jgi:hypothetical protein